MYVGTRLFAPQEETDLSGIFGDLWKEYSRTVRVPWL